MDRRTFIRGLLAAPAIVQARNIWVPPKRVITLDLSLYSTKTVSGISGIMTREQLCLHLLPELNELFGMDAEKYRAKHERMYLESMEAWRGLA